MFPTLPCSFAQAARVSLTKACRALSDHYWLHPLPHTRMVSARKGARSEAAEAAARIVPAIRANQMSGRPASATGTAACGVKFSSNEDWGDIACRRIWVICRPVVVPYQDLPRRKGKAVVGEPDSEQLSARCKEDANDHTLVVWLHRSECCSYGTKL